MLLSVLMGVAEQVPIGLDCNRGEVVFRLEEFDQKAAHFDGDMFSAVASE
jgi:hypothetical protein